MPGKNDAVYSIESKPNAYVFGGDSLKKYKQLHALKLQKFSIEHTEPDWQEKRRKIDEEYNKKRTEYMNTLSTRTGEINNIANTEVSNILKTKIDTDKLKQAADEKAKYMFPLPQITLNFKGNDEVSFILGKDEAQTDEKIEKLANDSVSKETTTNIDFLTKRNIDHTERSISFSKIDKTAISFIRDEVWTRFGKPVKRSPQFTQMRDDIVAFNEAFNEDKKDLGGDYTSSKERLDDMKAKLEAIAKSSRIYFEKNKGLKIFKSSQRRVEMAKNAYAMAKAKIKAIEKVYAESVAHDEEINRQRKQLYDETLSQLKQKEANSRSDLVEKANKTRTDALKKISNLTKDKLGKLNEEYEKKLKELDKEKDQYRKDKITTGIKGATNTTFIINEKVEYSEMSADQQFAVNSAKFSKLIFEEKHNPFAAYKDTVFTEAPEGEIPMDKDAMKDVLPLDELKTQLKLGEGQFPITYNTDALMTLSNLQFYDTMTGVTRTPNDYKVNFEFVKNGEHLPASALKDKGAEALAKEGYSCIVTGIKAEPKCAKPDEYTPYGTLNFSERSMIPAETVSRINDLDSEYVLKMVFDGTDKNGGHPDVDFSDSLKKVKKLISARSSNLMLDTDVANWKKFNVVSEKALKKNIASDNLDFRPARPGKKLKKKSKFKIGVVEHGGNYFDKDLMENLKLNVSAAKEFSYDFDAEFNEKLLSEKTIVLADQSLRTEAFNKLINTPQEDPALNKIASLVKEVSSMGLKDVLHYDVKYLTAEGESPTKPEKDVDSICSEAPINAYDLKAAELHKLIFEYTKDHEADLADPQSAASVLKNWKDKAYPKSKSVFNDKDPNCVIIDASRTEEGDSLTKFNGDGDYLCGAELTYQKYKYWDGEDKALNKQYEVEKNTFYMKPFTNEPLFTREPSISDIKQGDMGNCYFLAHVTSALNADPESIKDMIHDNDDGTVTCKFFNEQNQPTFVKVTKSVPYVKNEGNGGIMERPCSGERAPLWLHLLQKGYVLAGLRKFNDLSDYQDSIGKFAANAGGKKGDTLDVIKENVLKKRFGKDSPLASGGSDKLFERILNHSIETMDGGFSHEVYKHFTGEKARMKSISTMTGSRAIACLRDLDINDNNFCGDKLNNVLNDEEKNTLTNLCREAAGRLTMAKSRFSTDPKGNDFVQVDNVNMDDLVDAMNEVASKPAFEPLKSMNADKRMAVCKRFTDAMMNYQMNEPNPRTVIVSHKPGQYSASAISTFNTIKGHLNKKHGITCSFNDLNNRLSDVALKIPVLNQDVADGGILSAHEFSILNYKEVDGKKILYVRNPWGANERRTQTVTVDGPDGKEEISYENLALSKDQNSKDDGVFEMDINDFMECARDITFSSKEHSLNHNDVVSSLSTQYLKTFKAQEPEQYESLLNAHGYEKLFETTKKSNIIKDYAKKVFTIDDITKDLEDGVDMDPSKLEQVDDFKKELSSVFAPKVSKDKKLENGPEDKKINEKQRGAL